MGTEKSKGMTLYSLSGHVKNPGQFEAPAGHHPASSCSTSPAACATAAG